MKLGFIGCGTITAAMVTGLRAAGNRDRIIVSPRNAMVAASLASKFDDVLVAPANQAVLDSSELVVLAVRPQIAESVLAGLRFRASHHVLSLMSTVPLSALRSAIGTCETMTRAIPLPAVAVRQGPTAIFPPNPAIKAMFDTLGTAIELADEKEFNTFLAATAFMSSYFSFAGAVADWMAHRGVLPADADHYVSQMLRGLAETQSAMPDRNFAEISKEHETAGGLNEQLARQLAGKGVFAEVSHGLDAILARLQAANHGTGTSSHKT